MRPNKITRRAVDTARDDNGNPWAVSDKVLYRLCRDYPRHDDARAVTAKVLLIGRSYAAALERGRSSAGDSEAPNDLFYTRDVPRVLGDSELDQRITALRANLDIAAALLSILETHSYLCGLFAELTGKTKRSLASKYLHFHLPDLFFIFDSRAVSGLRFLEEGRRSPRAPVPQDGDAQYCRFVTQALILRNKLQREFSVHLTPRHVDRLLLAAAADSSRT